jgi:hypothetical protein
VTVRDMKIVHLFVIVPPYFDSEPVPPGGMKLWSLFRGPPPRFIGDAYSP